MNIIMGGRGYGKTARLIIWSADEQICILTANKERAAHIAKQAKKMGLSIPFPVTAYEFFYSNKFAGSSIRRDGILVDDADDVLQTIFDGIPIKEITITDHDEADNCIRYLPKPKKEGLQND